MADCNFSKRVFNIWPDGYRDEVLMSEVIPQNKTSRCAMIVFPGGAYGGHASYEGIDYAEFFADHGITSFSVDYRVTPHRYPDALYDARRAVQYVRANAEKYGIDTDKIAVIGSSAGGHLAALLSTSSAELADEVSDNISKTEYMPNAQILCYPVICNPEFSDISHKDSYKNLIGSEKSGFECSVDPYLLMRKDTPRAFIWHTAGDDGVNVINSYRYAEHLKRNRVPVEMHIFPDGRHGLALAEDTPHVAQWKNLVINWLSYINWIDCLA